jgi:preprotein translocase subunit SecF
MNFDSDEMNLNQKKSDFEFDFENAKLFSISLNMLINRNRTFNNKRVKRARLERVDEKDESKQENNDDEKSTFRERSIENENDDATNDVKKKKKNDDDLDKNVSRDNVDESSSRFHQRSSAKIFKKRKRV